MSKVAADTAAAFCATLADEWWRGGVRDAVVCPGSRSTPMALALLRHGGLRVSVRLDERGAGFFAVGLALGSGRPTVVLTTSGTAAVELHASVVEAHHAGVPLIVCTADRPPEAHDVGAPQTIDQVHLFGRAVRWFSDLGVPDEAARPMWRSFASRALAEAASGPVGPGPVHLNLPFREPLLGEPGELPPARTEQRAWHEIGGRAASDLGELADHLRAGARGIIVVGRCPSELAAPLNALGAELGWPVLADPPSGCRLAGPQVVGAADALLRDEGFAGEMMPEVVLRIGDPWASKVLAGWLSKTAAAGAVHIAVDSDWGWKDPGREVSLRTGGLSPTGPVGARSADGWLARWAAAEAAAQGAIDRVLGGHSEATEPGIARALYSHVPTEGCLFASSSMPVRDLEWFGRPRAAPPRVVANRGANGIDGVVSTTLGLAASGVAGGVFGLLGDLAVLHDASGLVRPVSGAPPMAAVITVLDNEGGGIFNFLPQASELAEAEFERLFGTPQLPAVAELVGACGYFVREITEAAEFEPALAAAGAAAAAAGLPAFVVVDTERRANVAVHGEIEAAVREALKDL
ncbi:MAG: 2-succinyl-5-enolpyruvyl-6-hydroxy-3-cyclohexene-1-carboxylic-acid synthase [Acidimicrobiales bacterium]|jgi:2-succinyl-5-enolpyruvyl-6-hydroxy-3-cyclohexene-1-carboxylate synthase